MTAFKDLLKTVMPYRLYAPLLSGLRYFTSLRYLGNRFHCPFCDGRFSEFLPNGTDAPVLTEMQVVGGGYRNNSKCPRCRSEDRERLVYLFLQKRKPAVFSAPTSFLHVAPERSLSRKLKSFPNISYTSGDLDSPVADLQMDITRIDLPSASFDLIICNHVLEHIPDDGKAMRELHRVTKPGGCAILQVPISPLLERTMEDFSVVDPLQREQRFGQMDHVRIYGRDYSTRLEFAGWSVATIGPNEFLNSDQIKEYALLENESIFVCEKAMSSNRSVPNAGGFGL